MYKHFCLYEVKNMLYLFKPEDQYLLQFSDSSGLSPNIDVFWRNHQNEIKNSYISIISDFKVRAQTLRAFELSLDLSYDLFLNLSATP